MFDENLARHHEVLAEARAAGAGLVVFPELGLTGYLLQDLAAEVAIRLDDPRLAGLAKETVGGVTSAFPPARDTARPMFRRPAP